jgi:hypothetical protein
VCGTEFKPDLIIVIVQTLRVPGRANNRQYDIGSLYLVEQGILPTACDPYRCPVEKNAVYCCIQCEQRVESAGRVLAVSALIGNEYPHG